MLNRFDDFFERRPALRAEDFKERGVGFEGCGVGRSLLDEIQAEVQSRSGSRFLEVRNVWVESNA